MNDLLNLEAEIKQITESNFNGLALKIFKAQYLYNKIYKTYCDYLKIDPNSINLIKQI